jgi:hypothetical protein
MVNGSNARTECMAVLDSYRTAESIGVRVAAPIEG